jgi:hypothetical protein
LREITARIPSKGGFCNEPLGPVPVVVFHHPVAVVVLAVALLTRPCISDTFVKHSARKLEMLKSLFIVLALAFVPAPVDVVSASFAILDAQPAQPELQAALKSYVK